MYQGPERRNYKRIKRHFIVKFRIRSQARTREFQDKTLSKWEVVTLQDLSAGGALLNYNKKIEADTLIDFRIEFPLTKDNINCVAKVLRAKEVPGKPIFHLAVVFTEIKEEEKDLINKFAEKLYLQHPEQFDHYP